MNDIINQFYIICLKYNPNRFIIYYEYDIWFYNSDYHYITISDRDELRPYILKSPGRV